MTGCGCLLLVAALAGLLIVMIMGSSDPGEPVEQAVALGAALTVLAAQLATSGGTRRRSAARS